MAVKWTTDGKKCSNWRETVHNFWKKSRKSTHSTCRRLTTKRKLVLAPTPETPVKYKRTDDKMIMYVYVYMPEEVLINTKNKGGLVTIHVYVRTNWCSEKHTVVWFLVPQRGHHGQTRLPSECRVQKQTLDLIQSVIDPIPSLYSIDFFSYLTSLC